MRELTASEMLDVWDTAAAWSPTRRALALLWAASPEAASEELAALSVGARDARLLSLREWFFGPRVLGQTACPACGEQLECAFEVETVRVAQPDRPLPTEVAGVSYRLPDSTDLEAIARAADEDTALHLLLQRCVASSAELTQGQVEALAERMSACDPQACVEIGLTCQACQHSWASVFDIAAFFWTEITAWAQRTLREVHALASAYGWSEQAILGLSAVRRKAYLELIGE
jgi:hypothetical protein